MAAYSGVRASCWRDTPGEGPVFSSYAAEDEARATDLAKDLLTWLGAARRGKAGRGAAMAHLTGDGSGGGRGAVVPVSIADIEAIDGEFAEHSRAVKELGFRLLVKRARVGQSKHVRVRPIFDTWSLAGSFVVTEDGLTHEVLQEIWETGCLRVALCDWRAGSKSSPGPYGRGRVRIKPA